jgi:hypothetical protein
VATSNEFHWGRYDRRRNLKIDGHPVIGAFVFNLSTGYLDAEVFGDLVKNGAPWKAPQRGYYVEGV